RPRDAGRGETTGGTSASARRRSRPGLVDGAGRVSGADRANDPSVPQDVSVAAMLISSFGVSIEEMFDRTVVRCVARNLRLMQETIEQMFEIVT
ncbi:hypothetical protein, partial [Nostocoides sp.]|uniref:hypothetical protein n=1 Tax=Nostocoides sp. TaxID=1917966 RepID=UPI002D1FB2D4